MTIFFRYWASFLTWLAYYKNQGFINYSWLQSIPIGPDHKHLGFISAISIFDGSEEAPVDISRIFPPSCAFVCLRNHTDTLWWMRLQNFAFPVLLSGIWQLSSDIGQTCRLADQKIFFHTYLANQACWTNPKNLFWQPKRLIRCVFLLQSPSSSLLVWTGLVNSNNGQPAGQKAHLCEPAMRIMATHQQKTIGFQYLILQDNFLDSQAWE